MFIPYMIPYNLSVPTHTKGLLEFKHVVFIYASAIIVTWRCLCLMNRLITVHFFRVPDALQTLTFCFQINETKCYQPFSLRDFKYIQTEIPPFVWSLAMYCAIDALTFWGNPVPSQETTRCRVSEESNLHSDRRKYLKYLILRSLNPYRTNVENRVSS